MQLTVLDHVFWALGFLGHVALLFVLWYRRRAMVFPFFTALIALAVIRTIVLYLVFHHGTRRTYFDTYWSLTIIDTLLQLCVVYEIASRVFRPLDIWAPGMRSRFAWLVSLSIMVALSLSWLASLPAPTAMQTFTEKGNLFAAALMSEFFVAMMALSVSARLPWKTDVARIAQGLGAYSLVTVLIETGHSYFGGGRELPVFVSLSHVRMAAYLCTLGYWIGTLCRQDRPSRSMPQKMLEELFTLQARLDYDLNDLRRRKKM